MHRMMRLFPLLAFAAIGCGPPGGGSILSRHGSCGVPTDGIIFLSWTIRGAAPSTASCQGIDQLSITIDGDRCSATIAPVPCTLDRWRYDGLTEGLVTATVTALSVNGSTVAEGQVTAQLDNVVPSSPTAVDLR
jgi:hypothetical protein